ncbi:ROK family protein [Oharaeibacter diazotrophicus]|uniref:Glucokinase n=3 Tax=Oharaeibacter diazotrophicus TaxID=1920512 RepID=A0A4R6R7Z8_9HYPH|nr:ROK family protein [Oharaeibacter diazotrophicus]TDP81885.1 glucokinase [Oharaeibacter diazotrophicus]BBE73517.1 glucokinase [Pleomorphomonas sp. SM30]GLS75306.1 glucokinase [Oharaeibacter diazotrophicus]
MRTAVGIDLGGTELRAALVAEDGRLLARRSTRTDAAGGPEAVLAQMTGLVADLDLAGARPVAVGVGAPGPLDAEAGVVTGPPTLAGWHGFPLRERLAAALGLSVAIDNDGHAAALGEWRFGAAIGRRHFVYVTVSTGIGGGVVCDGRLLRGRGGLAGHVGHMIVTDDDVVCSCGNRGCWEAVASGTAFGRQARRAAAADPAGRIAALAGTAPADARHVGTAAREGDPAALALVAEEARRLGAGIVGLIHLYSPEVVVIGGGLSALFDLFAPVIADAVATRAMPAFRDVAVVPAALGPDAGLVGAAALVLAPN